MDEFERPPSDGPAESPVTIRKAARSTVTPDAAPATSVGREKSLKDNRSSRFSQDLNRSNSQLFGLPTCLTPIELRPGVLGIKQPCSTVHSAMPQMASFNDVARPQTSPILRT